MENVVRFGSGFQDSVNSSQASLFGEDSGTTLPEPIIPESEEEKKYYASALRRRQLRLILAGKMLPDDATELKALFIKD